MTAGFPSKAQQIRPTVLDFPTLSRLSGARYTGAGSRVRRLRYDDWSLAFIGSASARVGQAWLDAGAEALSITRLEGSRWRKRRARWCYGARSMCLLESTTYETHRSANPASGPDHHQSQYFTRSGRRASGFVQVAKGLPNIGWATTSVVVCSLAIKKPHSQRSCRAFAPRREDHHC